MTTAVLHGPWVYAPNLSAESTGSIHDDDQARSLGFQSALVGGSVLASYVTPLLLDRLGQAFHERGFIKISFIAPVYTTDTFRVVLEERTPAGADAALLGVSLEKQGGGQAIVGYAGLALSADLALPPWQRAGEPVAPVPAGDADPLPDEPIGSGPPPKQTTIAISDSASRRTASGDTSPWYTESSPWGAPVVPWYMNMLVNLGNGGVRRSRSATSSGARAGMNGTFQLLQTGPIFADQPYTLQSSLAEKGKSGRTAFQTAEFSLTDAQGRRVALARQKVRWFVRNEG